ncbi:hypothetical protein A6X21_04580 [Planctopirus hydrillae]|uniref:Uncharacterized protein n=1 Tax=Planctopirus hydrillae TaxID=1841610 RepID=A0A1C3ENU0_9PLAN|nr:hypothetical protein A6X21_04580 [Planctopirus hydrillae]
MTGTRILGQFQSAMDGRMSPVAAGISSRAVMLGKVSSGWKQKWTGAAKRGPKTGSILKSPQFSGTQLEPIPALLEVCQVDLSISPQRVAKLVACRGFFLK